jgi:hypothetical protein
VILPAMILVSCGQGVSRASLVSSFVEANPDASTEQAECVVDRLIDNFDLPALETELEAEPLTAGFEEAQFRAMFVCGIEGDVATQITDQLVANGVEEADAPCVSDALVGQMTDDDIDVLLSGDITDAFYAKFFAAMQSCGAVDQ